MYHLIAYFLSNTSAKSYQKSVYVGPNYSKPHVGISLQHIVLHPLTTFDSTLCVQVLDEPYLIYHIRKN